MKATHGLLLALILGLTMTACGSRKTGEVRDRDPLGVTIVKVKAPPPPPRAVVVTRPARPGAGHVWIAGHYVYRGGRYIWVKGAWVKPPRKGVVWVPGRFDTRKGVWVSGRWR